MKKKRLAVHGERGVSYPTPILSKAASNLPGLVRVREMIDRWNRHERLSPRLALRRIARLTVDRFRS